MQSKFGQSLTNHEGVNTSGYKDTVFRTNCSDSVVNTTGRSGEKGKLRNYKKKEKEAEFKSGRSVEKSKYRDQKRK